MIRCLAFLIVLLPLPAISQEACTIGGTIVDDIAKTPVPRARVMLAGDYAVMKLTDDQGAFCFSNLDPGNYWLFAQKPGYLEARHGVSLTVEKGSEVKPVTLKMSRNGRLSGKVVDVGGDSVPGAEVKLWRRANGASSESPDEVDSTTADGDGGFRFGQLEPGTYYLSARPPVWDRHIAVPWVEADGQPARDQEVLTFFSGSFTFADATPVDVEPGKSSDNLMLGIKRARMRRISGHVENASPLTFLGYQETDNWQNDDFIPIAKDGSFVKTGIPPGRYVLTLGDGKRRLAQKEVDLTMGDVAGVTLEPAEIVEVPVVFHTEGKGPKFRPLKPGEAGPMLVSDDGSDYAVGLKPNSDGTYRFTDVERGVYHLKLDLWGQAFYIKDVSYGGETVTGNKIDLRGSRQGSLEITLSPKVAAVQGSALAGSEPGEYDHDDLTVILVDKTTAIAAEAATDQKGRFELRTLPPGHYRVYAIEGFDDDAWGSPRLAQTLTDKSVEIDLKEGEKKQVRVKVITAGEWKAALKKSGG